jgi:hypothetical protein
MQQPGSLIFLTHGTRLVRSPALSRRGLGFIPIFELGLGIELGPFFFFRASGNPSQTACTGALWWGTQERRWVGWWAFYRGW